uniref:AMP-binding protein n=1 Tax=Pollutimonas bauzanensis TaxID=658167 RepID=UPI0033406491
IVMPGANLKGDALYRLCESEGVSISAGVPSVWQGLLDHTEEKGLAFSTLRRAIIGGAACPAHMILAFARINVAVRHAWGMTEVSPLGTVCTLMPEHKSLSAEEQQTVLSSQGRPLFGAEFKIVDENGNGLPHDGVSTGDLMVKGNWVINNYYRQTESALANGWFHTGDVATIDKLGYLRITDRSKDVIKSGGEWISSIDIENIAMEHPDVRIAACIAQKHEKWGERPLLIIVRKPSATVAAADILKVFTNRIPKWSIPDEVRFIDDMPMTATGKLQKNALRKLFEN